MELFQNAGQGEKLQKKKKEGISQEPKELYVKYKEFSTIFYGLPFGHKIWNKCIMGIF